MDDKKEEIEDFFGEKILRRQIGRVALSLEARLTIDHLKGNHGAKLVNQQGRVIDVHPATAEQYQELCSLIDAYAKSYGEKPEFEVLKERWKYSPPDQTACS